jgi:DUF971 family protein
VEENEITEKLQLVGARLRSLRMEKNWTLEDTEDHGWHDWKYLQKIESGRNITLATLFLNSRVL